MCTPEFSSRLNASSLPQRQASLTSRFGLVVAELGLALADHYHLSLIIAVSHKSRLVIRPAAVSLRCLHSFVGFTYFYSLLLPSLLWRRRLLHRNNLQNHCNQIFFLLFFFYHLFSTTSSKKRHILFVRNIRMQLPTWCDFEVLISSLQSTEIATGFLCMTTCSGGD